MPAMLRRDDIRRLKDHHGEQAFIKTYIKMLTDGKIKAADQSLRALWEGLVGPVDETLGNTRQRGGALHYVTGRREGIASSAFPILTGALLASMVIEGYKTLDDSMDKLVTLMPSTKKVETIPGLDALAGPLEVDEGEKYEDTSFGEKYVTASSVKRGRILTITEETIIYDQLGIILPHAKMLGEKMRLDKNRRIARVIADVDATAWKPQNTATAIYSAANGNLIGSNALVDWVNIDTVFKKIAEQTDENDDEIDIMVRTLLVPRALYVTAKRIASATMTRVTAQAADPDVMVESSSPFAGDLDPVSSQLFDRHSTTNWFMGDFPRAFGYKEVFPIQTVAAPPGHEDEFDKDVKFKFKVREHGDPFCRDPKYVYKSQAAAL